MVALASMMHAAREPTRSVETRSGEAMKSIWRFIGECREVVRRYSVSSSRVVSLSSVRLRIAIDTSGVGTRIGEPVIGPVSPGSALEPAGAAPVPGHHMLNGVEPHRRRPLGTVC